MSSGHSKSFLDAKFPITRGDENEQVKNSLLVAEIAGDPYPEDQWYGIFAYIYHRNQPNTQRINGIFPYIYHRNQTSMWVNIHIDPMR